MTTFQAELANRLSMQRGLNLICTNTCLRLPLNETVRDFFTSASLLLAIDFHRSISQNVEGGSHAVAAALLRPLWECGVTGAWFLYRADEDRLFRMHANPLDVNHLWNDDADVPTAKQMLKELKQLAYVQEFAHNQEVLMAGNGKYFHKYTHPTVFQLKRTFVSPGMPTRFSNMELMGIVVQADLLLLACASVFQAQTQDHDLSLCIKDRYDQILSEIPNPDGTLTPWSPLPESQKRP